jgi:hypothetical protein
MVKFLVIMHCMVGFFVLLNIVGITNIDWVWYGIPLGFLVSLHVNALIILWHIQKEINYDTNKKH